MGIAFARKSPKRLLSLIKRPADSGQDPITIYFEARRSQQKLEKHLVDTIELIAEIERESHGDGDQPSLLPRALQIKLSIEKQLSDHTEMMADLGKRLNRLERPGPGDDHIRMTPFWMSRCEDCDKITPEYNGHHMFGFLVTDELWKAIASPKLGVMLCLRCVQRRLGRPMTPQDFPTHKINKDDDYKSRLVDYANDPDLENETL